MSLSGWPRKRAPPARLLILAGKERFLRISLFFAVRTRCVLIKIWRRIIENHYSSKCLPLPEAMAKPAPKILLPPYWVVVFGSRRQKATSTITLDFHGRF